MSYRTIVRLGLLLCAGHGAPVVTGQIVSLVLPEGIQIEGKVLGVEADGLGMSVSETSDRKAIAKGERLISAAVGFPCCA